MGMTESLTQESTRETMQESSLYPVDPYETGDGMYDGTGGIEDGAGSMGTEEGMTMAPDAHGGASQNGVHGTDANDGLMGDVTDGLESMGDDISNAVDDMTNNSRTRNR